MERVIRVCIMSGFEPLRVGLARTVATVGDMEVVGEASSFADLIAHPALREADVFVVDVDVISAYGSSVASAPLAQLNEWLPAFKILFLGNQENARLISPDDLPMYMRLSATGFLFRDGTAARLIQAIRLVAGGAFVCETSVIKRIITGLSHWASYTDESSSDQGGQTLSERETEVLVMVARGYTNKEIAQGIFLSEGTVKSHVSHVMAKLKVDRRADLVRYALSKGVIPLPAEDENVMERRQPAVRDDA